MMKLHDALEIVRADSNDSNDSMEALLLRAQFVY